MWFYLARRFLLLTVSLVVASVVIFFTLEVVPGDPASFMLGLNAAPDTVAALREELGLGGSPTSRYFAWISGLPLGDFGISYTYRVPVAELIANRLWVSVPLALYAMTIASAVAIPVGMYAARHRGQMADFAVMGVTQLGIAVPNFWVALLLVLVFAITLGWFSAGGFPGWDAGLGTGLKALTLPAIALASSEASILARVMRSSLLETLGQDYIRTARAKGLTESQALRRHALRNAMIPVLTIIGLQFPFLLASSIIIENIFFLPGIGRLIVQAISARDIIVVESVVMLMVFAVILVMFLIEVVYVLVDPRLRRA